MDCESTFQLYSMVVDLADRANRNGSIGAAHYSRAGWLSSESD
jgi:hypothetical protein